MRVLEPGNGKPPEFRAQCTCHGCSAVLEYVTEDIRWRGSFASRYRHDVDGDLTSEWYEVQCPQCRIKVCIQDPPESVRNHLRPRDL